MESNAEDKEQAIKNVVNDKEFLKSVIKMNIKDAQNAFADKGVTLSDSEMIAIKDVLNAQINKDSKLSEQILENIGGGDDTISRKIKNISLALASVAIIGSVATVAYKSNKELNKMGIPTFNDIKQSVQGALDTCEETAKTANDTKIAAQKLKDDLDYFIDHRNPESQ